MDAANRLEQLRADWPDWSIWMSRRGDLIVATRQRYLTRDEEWHGLYATLVEDNPDTLISRLKAQRELEEAP